MRVLLALWLGGSVFSQTPDSLPRRRETTILVYPPERHAPIHKATAVHLFGFMALIGRTDIVPKDPQGIAVTRLKSTDDPANRNDDDDLTAYGVNSGQNNILYNTSMQGLDVYEGKTPKQRLKHPHGIACDNDGRVYVADTGNDRIVRLHNPGTHLEFVSAYGSKGKKAGEFDQPNGVALDGEGRVYVTDTGNDRIQVFDSTMKWLYAIDNTGDSVFSQKLFKPVSITVLDPTDRYQKSQDSAIFIVDLDESRIQKFSRAGQFLSGVVSSEYGFEKVRLTSLAADQNGNVWATDAHNHCIHKFDSELRYVATFGSAGDGENQFIEPRGIAIWKRFGQAFVCDKISAQYFHIGTDMYRIEITQSDSGIHFDFFLAERSQFSARIVDEKGNAVATLASSVPLEQGHRSLYWNRRTDLPQSKIHTMLRAQPKTFQQPEGVRAPPGLYRVILEAKTFYIYNRYFTKRIELEFAI